MSVRRSLVFAAIAAVFLAAFSSPAHPANATGLVDGQDIASHTYYQLDPANASMSVRMEATVASDNGDRLENIVLFAMPGAQDIVVRQDGTPLILVEVVGADDTFGVITGIEAKLITPLKGKLTADIELTYTVPARSDGEFRIEPGRIETPFVSQGPGSFVSVDMPAAGDNYIDPGCLLAADQSAAASGYERYVCGETLLLAIYAEDPDILERCARLDNSCRQQSEQPYIAYAQSVTNPSLLSVLEADLALEGDRHVKMSLRYFKADAAWAQEQFDTAKLAFPLLETAFGFPYPHDSVVLRQSNAIGSVGIAGVAFSTIGEVLVSNTGNASFDKEVTVHELAHQWAGRQLATKWIWEGQAEWGMRTVGRQLGITASRSDWDSLGYTDPLATWYGGSDVFDPDYWYGKSGAFWVAFEEAVGGSANMTAVLARVDDNPDLWPLDGEWFQDTGERVSGANLDSLFLSWVYDPEIASSHLATRRAVWDSRASLIAEAAARGIEGEPAGIRPNLDIWSFKAAQADIDTARALLTSYDAVLADSAAIGLAATPHFAQAWAEASLADLRRVLEEQRNAVTTISDATAALASVSADSPSLARLEEARTAYAEGRFTEAAATASQAVSDSVNLESASRMLAAADERQAGFSSGFIASVGLFGADPDASLADAHAAYADGRGTEALLLATDAYETWGSAQRNGMFRLALGAGGVCAILVAIVYLFGKRRAKRTAVVQHEELVANRPTWRDFENTR